MSILRNLVNTNGVNQEPSSCVTKTDAQQIHQVDNPLQQAYDIQSACAGVGFDWPNVEPVFNKVREELDEIQEAMSNPNKSQTDIIDEVGDLFFACVNLSRHLQVDPLGALGQATVKFSTRFQFIENALSSNNEKIEDKDLVALEALWELAKSREKNNTF